MIASNELSKIVSDYYNETSVIESGLNDKSIVIRFYNKISEIETMDYSIVRLTYDGKIKALFSRSNVELHNKYQDCEINTEDFDLTVKDAIDKHYPNYQRDDDTVFINIIYKDCYIKNRWLTTDNDGDLIIIYSARAIFDYEIKYKNEEAIIAEDKGLPIQGNGQTELPVTAIVKAIK
ncbi:MAG: hypothetical protein MJ137_07920 [Clostridia bacterium]|nr:hypothetical protein [Clostridia bacterium]